MNTTYLTNASTVIGLAQETKPASPATVTRAVATPAQRRKTLARVLLAVACSATALLVFKAATLLSAVFLALDLAYDAVVK